ncbi:inverse autotransporter beta domain-containing protein, partial [Enterobacter asburiae]|uniref:inverse autotransporter beta domain-containing protein n=1 Tax=Scandinavium sp. UTDF21-P1B TaxID=3446379 RepID=UPI00347BDCFC
MDIINQRSSKNIAILVLFHYIFTLLVLFFPTGLRASPLPDNQPADAASYILYQKPQGQSWREVGSQLAPQISDIERWQRDLAEQYGLNFSTSTFLLPADARLAQMYPQVTLVAVARQENLDDFAWRYQLSRQQLINLNRSLKTPHQLADLAGQWVIVPEQLPAAKAENSAAAEKLRDILGSFWQSAQQHGAVSSARSQVASTANASLTAEVENWLKRSGARARVTADLGLDKGSSTDFGLDYLYPFFTGEDDTLFVQLNGHRWNDRNMLNVGLGWRHNFNSQLMGGANAFYDQDITRHHSRLGAGLELWSERLHGSANYYLPLSDWRRSDAPFLSDSDHYVLNERAASGWDLNLEAALARTLSGWAGIYQWYGEKVDVNGSRSQASKDPYGLNLGVKWQPVPLVTLRSEQQFISGQNSNFNVGVDLRWEFGRSLAEMLDTDKAQALPSLLASRTEFVHRNNNIVLAYQQQQKSWHIYFDPAELTTQAGSAAFIHGVKGAGGAHVVYRSAQPNTAAVESTTGRVTPLQTGETTISAELYAAVNDAKPAAVAQYRLTVLPGEFAPSVSDVQIQGESVIGNTLKGSYRYHANQGEAESGSVLQWFHARDLSQPLASGDSYQVSARDIDQTLVFQVIPQNKKNIRGDAATAQIAGPTVKLAAMRFEPLDHGIKVDDATVKFLKSQRGKIQFLVKALDGQGRPLADRPVWWRQNNNALGALSEVQTRTDANGLATVMLENITSAGQDEIIASLQKSASAYAADEAHVEARSPLTVIQVQPEITLTVKDNVQQVPVASVPLTFQLALEEEDLLGVANRPIRWQSNGKPAGASVTDDAGLAAIELPVPEVYGNGEWRIEAVLADVNRQASLSLTLQKNPVPALAVKDVTLSWGEVAPALQVTGGNNSNYQYRSDDNKVVAVDEQGLLTVNGTGSTTITVSQQAT